MAFDQAAHRRRPRPNSSSTCVDAAETRTKTPNLKLLAPLGEAKISRTYRAGRGRRATGDKLAPWAETLTGGDVEKGRNVLLNNNAVYCQRCHKLDGQGGEVGPPLNGIAAQPGKDRRYLLESVLTPSAQDRQGVRDGGKGRLWTDGVRAW